MTRLGPAMCGRSTLLLRCARLIALALVIGVAVQGLGLSTALMAELERGVPSLSVVWIVLLLYVALLAIPFVPSAEIGLAVMLVLGSSMALPVYAATVIGLTLAFIAGRQAHPDRCGAGADDALGTSDGIALLHDRLRNRPTLQHLLRFRGLAFIALINMPGNTVLGGGGGIAMAVGYSRTLTPGQFLLWAAVGVAPVPAFFLAADHLGLESSVRDWLNHIVASLT